jgi:hypothetical protein
MKTNTIGKSNSLNIQLIKNPIVNPIKKQHRCRSWDTRSRCRSRPQAWPPSWWAPRARCGARCGTSPKQRGPKKHRKLGDVLHVKLYIQYYDVIYIYMICIYIYLCIQICVIILYIYVEQCGYTLPIYIYIELSERFWKHELNWHER